MQIPLFTGRGVAERVARARLEERKLELQQQSKRSDLELAGFRAYQALQEANRGSDLSKLELEYARQNLDVILVQFEEGRIALDDLESARLLESTALGGLMGAGYTIKKARLTMLYAMGEIVDAFTD